MPCFADLGAAGAVAVGEVGGDEVDDFIGEGVEREGWWVGGHGWRSWSWWCFSVVLEVWEKGSGVFMTFDGFYQNEIIVCDLIFFLCVCVRVVHVMWGGSSILCGGGGDHLILI